MSKTANTAMRVHLFLFLASLCFIEGAHACTVCHSKDPKMVRMHEALEFKDCFLCHGPATKRSGSPPQEQMSTDKLCVRCQTATDRTGTR
jgi:hypothetical protein